MEARQLGEGLVQCLSQVPCRPATLSFLMHIVEAQVPHLREMAIGGGVYACLVDAAHHSLAAVGPRKVVKKRPVEVLAAVSSVSIEIVTDKREPDPPSERKIIFFSPCILPVSHLGTFRLQGPHSRRARKPSAWAGQLPLDLGSIASQRGTKPGQEHGAEFGKRA